MGYRSLKECVEDLERAGELVRITEEVDPDQQMAEIHRRVYAASGPALLFTNVKGSKFPAVSNLFGTDKRTHYIFRDTINTVKHIFSIKADPKNLIKYPLKSLKVPFGLLNALPKKVSNPVILDNETKISKLPGIKSWPMDGGPFITLPQVFTQSPGEKSIMKSNLGMYRIQLSGGKYEKDSEIGLHYQIHRGIGIHHTKAAQRGEKLPVSIFVGGPPSQTLAAVMPLPPFISELTFSGMMGGRRFTYTKEKEHFISGAADFCITGWIDTDLQKPEGPFGDHLGYYSLAHNFPVMKVKKVYYRPGAVWPFTVVGRPPQEDTSFGHIIHELTADLLPQEISGVKELEAVDASGVHPLMLAIGTERYVPYEERKPMELLTIANSILGYGQCSLAKYLLITAREDNEDLKVCNYRDYFTHVLERVRWEEDLHFQTNTTMDTLDYTGSGINSGSKLVVAAAGQKRRSLSTNLPTDLKLPDEFKNPKVALPGVMALTGPQYKTVAQGTKSLKKLCKDLTGIDSLNGFPLIVLVDDSEFTAKSIENFIWVTFTRSNPAADIDGVGSSIKNKHWGCTGPLIIDARIKPHHAPVLETDPDAVKFTDNLGAKGGSLHGII